MSKPKGLEFQASEPAFLRRIRGEIAGKVDDPDRQINPVGRPTHIAKRLEKDEDDAPTYVLEDSSATLTKDEYEALLRKPEDEAPNGKTASLEPTKAEERSRPKQKLAEIGGPKKRKVAKVIATDEDEDAAQHSPLRKAASNPTGKSKGADVKVPRQKKPKVNLKFDDGDADENA